LHVLHIPSYVTATILTAVECGKEIGATLRTCKQLEDKGEELGVESMLGDKGCTDRGSSSR